MNKKICLLFAVSLLLLFTPSCNKKELGYKISGKWYLTSYEGDSVNWGEYMDFSGNTLKWNSRLHGTNSTYKITYGSNYTSFNAKCTYTSSGESLEKMNNAFVITEYSSTKLVLIDKYSDIRVFRPAK